MSSAIIPHRTLGTCWSAGDFTFCTGMGQVDTRTRCHSLRVSFQKCSQWSTGFPWALRKAMQWFNCLPWLFWNTQQLPVSGCIPSSNEAQVATAGKRLWPVREGTVISRVLHCFKPIPRPCLCSHCSSKASVMEYQDAGVCRSVAGIKKTPLY